MPAAGSSPAPRRIAGGGRPNTCSPGRSGRRSCLTGATTSGVPCTTSSCWWTSSMRSTSRPPRDRFAEVLGGPIERMYRFAGPAPTETRRSRCSTTRCSSRAPGRTDVLRYCGADRPARAGGPTGPGSRPSPTSACFASGTSGAASGSTRARTAPRSSRGMPNGRPWGASSSRWGRIASFCEQRRLQLLGAGSPGLGSLHARPQHRVGRRRELERPAGGNFRVARRARMVSRDWSSSGAEQWVVFRHDGFRHPPRVPLARAESGLRPRGSTRSRTASRAAGRAPLRCDGVLHLAPEAVVLTQGRPAGG